MNARQKAKKYKKELDILKGRAQIPFLVEKTLNSIEIIGASVTYYGGGPDEDEMIAELAEIIANNPDFRKSIDFWVDREPYGTCTACGRLKVVMPDDNSSDR